MAKKKPTRCDDCSNTYTQEEEEIAGMDCMTLTEMLDTLKYSECAVCYEDIRTRWEELN
jgi:hypothetical protein